MAFQSTQLNFKLTDYGYQKVMALDGKPVGIKFIALGKGNAANTRGYNVSFRDTRSELAHLGVIKQIDSSEKTSYTENGEQLARIDTATIFDGPESFDVREVAFYDEDESGEPGKAVYIWSSSDPADEYAPKRPKIHLVVSISQHLLFSDEASAINVIDAGLPFELFLQPLKDDFEEQLSTTGLATLTSLAGITSDYMIQVLTNRSMQSAHSEYSAKTSEEISELQQKNIEFSATSDQRYTAQQSINDSQGLIELSTLTSLASLTGGFMRNSLASHDRDKVIAKLKQENELSNQRHIAQQELNKSQELINLSMLTALSSGTAATMNITIGVNQK